jgi:LacI family gluconate utilization system Gnt-I transcriptional repressor
VTEDFRAHERGKAFVAAARAQRGVSAQAVTAPPGDAFEAGRAVLALTLDTAGRPGVDAVAFANDNLACGALLEAQQRGIAVPRDVALMGFGDFAIGRQLGGGLTTVHPPRHEIGVQVARTILEMLQAAPASGARRPSQRRLRCTLVGRHSTAPA